MNTIRKSTLILAIAVLWTGCGGPSGDVAQEANDAEPYFDQAGTGTDDVSLEPTPYFVSFRHKVIENDQPLSRTAARLRENDPTLQDGTAQFRINIHEDGDPTQFRLDIPASSRSATEGVLLRAIMEVTNPSVEPTGIVIKAAPGSSNVGRMSGGEAVVYFGVGANAEVFKTRDSGWFDFQLTDVDREANSASGKFQFLAMNSKDPDDHRTLVVMEGRFELPLSRESA